MRRIPRSNTRSACTIGSPSSMLSPMITAGSRGSTRSRSAGLYRLNRIRHQLSSRRGLCSHPLRLSAAQFFVTQYSARATFARSIYGKQTGILWLRVLPHCPGGNSHNVASLRLDCYAAAFYEQLTFYHEVVLTVRMFIGPRFRSQFPLKQLRFGPTALQRWRDDSTFRFVVAVQFGSRIFRWRARSVGHCPVLLL